METKTRFWNKNGNFGRKNVILGQNVDFRKVITTGIHWLQLVFTDSPACKIFHIHCQRVDVHKFSLAHATLSVVHGASEPSCSIYPWKKKVSIQNILNLIPIFYAIMQIWNADLNIYLHLPSSCICHCNLCWIYIF